eukprot:SAG31_NODE_7124_length_1782_cov_2.603684_1_plen_82_part_00
MGNIIPREYFGSVVKPSRSNKDGGEYDIADDDMLVIKVVAFIGLLPLLVFASFAETWHDLLYASVIDITCCFVLASIVLWF